MKKRKIIIGSRGSQLALVQSEWVLGELQKRFSDYQFELIKIKTQGDKILDVPLAKIGDKGLFTKELESALLSKEIDLAVHSMKDVPTRLPEGLILSTTTERENPQDAFVSNKFNSIEELPQGAVVGTSSLRRIAQIKAKRPDLVIKDLRGNLNTRMARLDDGEFDAIILAAAGLTRLGWKDRIRSVIPTSFSLPAVGQGALAIEVRQEDEELRQMLTILHHVETHGAVLAERALLRELEGGCQVPIGALGRVDGSLLKLEGLVADLEGKEIFRDQLEGPVEEAESLGLQMAHRLKRMGADRVLQAIFEKARVDYVPKLT